MWTGGKGDRADSQVIIHSSKQTQRQIIQSRKSHPYQAYLNANPITDLELINRQRKGNKNIQSAYDSYFEKLIQLWSALNDEFS